MKRHAYVSNHGLAIGGRPDACVHCSQKEGSRAHRLKWRRLRKREVRALRAAFSAIYFKDNSDYQSALWQVVNTLQPLAGQALEDGGLAESAMYDRLAKDTA